MLIKGKSSPVKEYLVEIIALRWGTVCYPYLVWRQTGVEGGEGGIMIWGVKKGGTWRTMRVPDKRNGGQGHS